MSDVIRDRIAGRIYDGSLQPGERLRELAIAEEFGTSQTPVREALRELEALRLVHSEAYKGTRVREITAREMTEVYLVRAILEQRAAELAGSRLENNVEPLNQAVDRICDSAAEGDVDGYARHNLDFHRQIVVAADNMVLLQTWDSLRFEAKIRINLIRKMPSIVERAAEHRPIVAALRRGDGDAAGRLLREHSESFAAVWAEEAAAQLKTQEVESQETSS
ncbi:GntR family transcriptional regulator [Rosistilla oblonga]|uniref:GntR family transcriptional regulator n=1 Tax=Rosistilla oblonga TaxID=2527990 RepID=UPI003A970795